MASSTAPWNVLKPIRLSLASDLRQKMGPKGHFALARLIYFRQIAVDKETSGRGGSLVLFWLI